MNAHVVAHYSPAESAAGYVRLSRTSLHGREEPGASAYHVARQSPEIVHFGPGRVFKGLFAPLVDRASRSRFDDGGSAIGITAVFRSSRSTGFRELTDQDGLYLLQTAAEIGETTEPPPADLDRDVLFVELERDDRDERDTARYASIVSCIRDVVLHEDLERLGRTFTDPRLKIVSTSITAAAYDERSQPDVDRDIRVLEGLGGRVLDTAALGTIRLHTTFGVLLLGLMQRHERCAAVGGQSRPVTLLALENLESNGDRLKDRLVAMAEELARSGAVPDGFTSALIDDVRSPNLVIDRIVPGAPSRILFETPAAAYECRAQVVTEPDGRIVVAGDAHDPDPNLAILGDTIRTTTDLESYSQAKTGLLNAVQALSAGVWLQTRSTATSMPEFIATREARSFVEGLLHEISNGLDSSRECDIDEYRVSVLSRLQNAELGDAMVRLASDLPRKLEQYVAPVVRRALLDDRSSEHLIDALCAALGAVNVDPRSTGGPGRPEDSRSKLVECLSGGDLALLQELMSRLAAAERKKSTIGLETVFAPIVSVDRPVVAEFERAGLCMDAFKHDPERFPVRLDDDAVILFDNDGTLVNSEAIALEAAHGLVTDILARHEAENPLTVAEFSDRFAGKNFRIILSELNDDLLDGHLDDVQIQRYSDEEDDRCVDALDGSVTATPHTLETLRWVPRGQKAVVTSASRRRCDVSLFTLGIENQFDGRIFSAIDTLPKPKPKPDPAIYEHSIVELGLRCGERSRQKSIVVIEDSASGVISARRAGADYVIGFVGADNLPTAHHRQVRAQSLRQAGATDIIDDMALLPLVLVTRGLAHLVN